jgi:multiple sugar transport system substrate-binding protein
VYTGNREADETIFADIDLSDYPQFEEAVRVVLEVQEQSFGLPPSPAAAQFENAWTSAVNEVMTGDGDPAQALQQADQQAQDDIDGAAR